ncbi:MAG TPA: 50S ribosomal protein L3 N(5)-glutamine methyltransferase [Burkholderiales bacterium]|nr:50S ribosomal protein L3 N(5)-glutamine methyltransferase [Burkholderiales bacterium]
MKRRQTRRATVARWWREIERRFRSAHLAYGHGTHGAREEAAWLVCHVLRIPFDRLNEARDGAVSPAAGRRLAALTDRRIRTREPLAYLLREAWLQHRHFYVDRRVIVPRSHIAELLPDGLSPWLPQRGPRRVLDLCTGSGCLAILAAQAFPRARVDASDVSSAALAVARRNVAAYRLRRRVRLVRSDLFAALGHARYDLILCNPPYVPEAEMRRLPAEYRHEPRRALESGRDGLDFVRRLIAHTAGHLARRGLLVVEIGDGRAAVERAFPRLAVTWLETAAGPDLVFAVTREELAG